MVNPLLSVYNMFAGVLSVLPGPILSLIYLVFALFIILCIVKIITH